MTEDAKRQQGQEPTHAEAPTSSAAAGEDAIVLVDKTELRRAAFTTLLESWTQPAHLSVLGASPESDFSEDVQNKSLRLVMVNVGALPINSPEAQTWIETVRAHLPGVPMVILSDRDDPQEAIEAFRAGVRGFIPTNSEIAMVHRILSFILGGGSFFPPKALLNVGHIPGRQIEDEAHGQASGLPLTARQQEVIDLLVQGKSNKLIARELDMQEATVKVHVRHIMRKLGVSNRTQAALRAAHFRETPTTQRNAPATLDHAKEAV